MIPCDLSDLSFFHKYRLIIIIIIKHLYNIYIILLRWSMSSNYYNNQLEIKSFEKPLVFLICFKVSGYQRLKLFFKDLLNLKILKVEYWTNNTCSFSLERPNSLWFKSVEFLMIGLNIGDKPLLRAYSIALPSWGGEIDFIRLKLKKVH